MSSVSVIILTFNDEIHIKRTIESILPFAEEVIVVDSLSTDRTVEIAEGLGAMVVRHAWENSAGRQLNWAFKNVPMRGEWFMHMASDEYPTPELIEEIDSKLSTLGPNVTGIMVNRRIHFIGKWVKHGDVYGRWVLRLFRTSLIRSGKVFFEECMDEHIVLEEGETISFRSDMVDDNLRTLSEFVDKHNGYATREAVDVLSAKYLDESTTEDMEISGFRQKFIRFMKTRFYYHLPPFFRAFVYFMYRYLIKLGFLDGKEGLAYHFLQGFWYRFLVDAKIREAEVVATREGIPMADLVTRLVKSKGSMRELHKII